MALYKKRAEAVSMRKEGASYSQIKDALKVSKSTLSLWLRDMPLSSSRMKEVRDNSAIRIERFRATMKGKRDKRLAGVYEQVSQDIGRLNKREIFIAGLFLYWGEGGKTTTTTTTISNTDLAVLRFFIGWLLSLGVAKERIRAKIHLYKDMDVGKETKYWARTLGIKSKNFRKPYIKDSTRSGLSYPQKFIHGTCNVYFENRDVMETVLMSLEYIRSEFAESPTV